MAQIKISREELKHDEVLETTDKVLRWIKTNGTLLLTVIAAAFLVYAIIMVIHGNRQRGLISANDLLAQAQSKYAESIVTTEWSTDGRIDAMNEVIALADRVIQEHAGTPLARQAQYLKGTAYYSMGDDLEASVRGAGAPNTDNAIDAYTRLVAEAQTPMDRAKGNLALAYAYENRFFLTDDQIALSDAIQRYRLIHEDEAAPDFIRAEAMLGNARLLAYGGKKEEAKALYLQVLKMRKVEAPTQELDPADAARMEIMVARQLKMASIQFSAAENARRELGRMGVNVDELEGK